jgi:hypothetical protein
VKHSCAGGSQYFTISCIKLGLQQKNPVVRQVMHLTLSSSYVNIYWRRMPKLGHHDLPSIFKLYIGVHFSNTMNFHIWIHLPTVQNRFLWPTFYTLITWVLYTDKTIKLPTLYLDTYLVFHDIIQYCHFDDLHYEKKV